MRRGADNIVDPNMIGTLWLQPPTRAIIQLKMPSRLLSPTVLGQKVRDRMSNLHHFHAAIDALSFSHSWYSPWPSPLNSPVGARIRPISVIISQVIERMGNPSSISGLCSLRWYDLVLWLAVGSSIFAFGQSKTPLEVQRLEREAKLAAEHGDLDRAATVYKQIVKLEPRLAEARSNLGMIYFTQRKFREAGQAFEEALRLQPRLAQPSIFLGITRAELGQCHQATPLLNDSFVRPLTPELHRLIGLQSVRCYDKLGKPLKAVEVLLHLRREYPSDPDVLYSAARFYSDLSTDALLALRRANPDSYRFHQMLGEIMEMRGDYTRAEAHLRAALEQNPDTPGLHYELGKIILLAPHDADARERAKKEFEAELAVSPDSAAAEYQLALLARQRNNAEEAEQRFRRAIELNPDSVDALMGLGKILIASGNLQGAIVILEKARSLEPENEAAHYWLANALRRAGRSTEAERETSAFRALRDRSAKQKNTVLDEPFLKPAETAPEEEDQPPKP